jgi:hypothetical protein
VEFRKVRSRRVIFGLLAVGPPALFEVRDAAGTSTVTSPVLRELLGISGRDYQEMHTTASRLFTTGDPGWVQPPYGGVVRDH